MIKYSPFNGNLNELNEKQLQLLIEKEVAEGWYIEYKNNLILDGRKIAKSVSSFANSEGGWYFMGIDSDQKTNKATELTGVDIADKRDIADQISKLITGNVSPVPSFDIRIVELHSKRSVIIVKIEEGQQPPYTTSSGTIYQREHNASNPVKDRYILEKLYEKAQTYKDRIDRFCKIDYAETKGQGKDDQAYLELYLFPTPYNNFFFKNFSKPEFFDSIAEKFFGGMNFTLEDNGEVYETGLGFSFNSIYTSYDSLVVRPMNDDNIIYKGTTIELFRNGNLKLLLPLFQFGLKQVPNYYSESETINYLLDKFSPYESKMVYPAYPMHDSEPYESTDRKKSNFVDWFRLVDGHEMVLAVLFVTKIYQSILKENGVAESAEIGFRALLSNLWRKVIFFDNSKFLNSIRKYNIPATPKNYIEIPNFVNGNHLVFSQENYAFVLMCEAIFEGIGIPRDHKLDYMDILKKSIDILKSKSS